MRRESSVRAIVARPAGIAERGVLKAHQLKSAWPDSTSGHTGHVEFSHEDRMALQRAQGWLELHLPMEANEELDEIQPAMRAHPDVLKLRYSIFSAAKKWDMALEVANCLHRQLPADPYGGVHAAVALYRLGRTQEAKELSLGLAPQFPKDWSIPYNLACYCAQLGEIEEAQEWFKAAMALEEDIVRRMGIDDPDLEPLWQGMRDTTWKRGG